MSPQAARAIRTDSADASNAASNVDAPTAAALAAASALLDSAEAGLAPFFAAFYRGAPPDDVLRYAPDSLAALASLVYSHSAQRKSGETLVQLFDFQAQTGGQPRNETVFVAVNDDMPFLFDSLMAEASVQALRVHAVFHPIVATKRDADGRRSETGEAMRESVIVLVLDPALDADTKRAFDLGAHSVFRQVRLAVRDWRTMLDRMKETIAGLKSSPPPISPQELAESVAFLEWLGDNHFTFLGSRDTRSATRTAAGSSRSMRAAWACSPMPTRASCSAARPHRPHAGGARLPHQPEPLIVTKSNERSLVHRRVHMDYIGVKTFNAKGNFTGERRFVGLFTSSRL